jgi:diacylglycerol O-acyltransferase
MPTTKTLSVLDMAFFALETRERMSNIGPLAILKPPAGTRSAKAFADRLMKQMKARPVGTPFDFRYRPPSLQGLPRLETVDAVDLDQHCHRLTLPAPGTNAQLFEFVCRLHEKRLDRSFPPWQFYIIDGLDGGRVAVYAKVHHGLIDGRGFVEVCTRWFTPDPADKTARALWEGLSARRSVGPLPDRAPMTERVARAAIDAGRTMLSLYVALAKQALSSAGLTQGMPLPFLGTPAALRARPSVRRSFAYCNLPLAQMKALGQSQEASVNDVLLTVLDIALNRYLADKGRPAGAQPLVVDMPVALAAGAGEGGNKIAVLQFPLGAVVADPVERLRAIHLRAAQVKQHARQSAEAMVAYTAVVHSVPALLELLNIERAPMIANMMISNPFGLPERRYLAGAELEMALPLSVLPPGQSLNITAITYGDALQIAFLGLAAELPDIQRLADLTVEAFAELAASASPHKRRRTRAKPAHTRTKETSR